MATLRFLYDPAIYLILVLTCPLNSTILKTIEVHVLMRTDTYNEEKP